MCENILFRFSIKHTDLVISFKVEWCCFYFSPGLLLTLVTSRALHKASHRQFLTSELVLNFCFALIEQKMPTIEETINTLKDMGFSEVRSS